MITITRYHDFSAGHRVLGHEGKCAFLHGHNYRVHFTCRSDELDSVGRVIDFSVVKELLCRWLEHHWDHKFLAYESDMSMNLLADHGELADSSIVWVPFNPTAENMAMYLVEDVGPRLLEGSGVVLTKVVVEETRKCSATYERDV